MTSRTLLAARQLLENGLPCSAWNLLNTLPDHSQAINSLKQKARRMVATGPLDPGFYALATWGDKGIVVPLRAEIGPMHAGSPLEPSAWEAVERGHKAARRLIRAGGRHLPSLRIHFPSGLGLFGESVGFPAALAFLAKWSGQSLDRPVLATGMLSQGGRVHPVGGLAAKLDAALEELGGTEGLVLIPASGHPQPMGSDERILGIASLQEAVTRIWKRTELPVDPAILSLSTLLKTEEEESDHHRALDLLEAYDPSALAPSDRALLLFRMGIRFRHLGETRRAADLHEQAIHLCSQREKTLGREVFEGLEMEKFATEVDLFLLDSLEERLRERLRRPFLALHNQVRCRGILAQVLSTTGCHGEALALRRRNLADQEESDAMRREIPRTLACLVHEAARAGRSRLFDEFAARLLRATMPGDEIQHRFNARALSLGMVLLRRHAELLTWIEGDRVLWGHSPPGPLRLLLRESSRIERYPEVTTARALVRALRKTGRPQEAVGISRRTVVTRDRTLVQWLTQLVVIEGTLAEFESSGDRRLARKLSEAADRLRAAHEEAARFHAGLLRVLRAVSPDRRNIERLENEIDSVYY